MSITTEIQRLRTNVNNIRQNTSDILDAIENKGVEIPAGSTLDDCAGLISQIETGGGGAEYCGYVEIAGYKYPITRVGNKLWLAQNLDYYDSDFVKNAASISDTQPQVNYYDNDEATYGKNGLKLGALYNYPAIELLISKNIFPTGWRVPSLSDVTDLRNKVSSVYYEGIAANLFDNPQPSYSSWVPNENAFGFCAIPSGLFNNSYLFKDEYLFLWTTTDYSENKKTLMTFAGNVNYPTFTDAYKDRQYSVRLCCDM